jgi:hypothetical protein
MVMDKEANLTIGYTSSSAIRNYYMTASYIYFTSNLIWITPPGRIFTAIEKLQKPFREVLWTCILAVFMLSFITIAVVRFQSKSVQNFVLGQGNSSPCLNIFNIFFGGSLPKLPVRNFARTLLGFFMIYCLIIRSSYSGALFNFMRSVSREKDVANIGEMVAKDFKFYVVEASSEFVKELPRVANR